MDARNHNGLKLSPLAFERLEARRVLSVNLFPTTPYSADFGGDSVLSAGETFTVQYTIGHAGDALAAGSYESGIYLSRDNAIQHDDYLLAALPGVAFGVGFATHTDTQQVTLPPADDPFWQGSGGYRVGVWIDHLDQIVETNESNIEFEIVLVQVDTAPDLRVVAADINPAGSEMLMPGELADFAFTYDNPSGTPITADEYDVQVYLTPSATLNSEARLLATLPGVDLLTPADVQNEEIQVTLPDANDDFWQGQGTYHLGAFLRDSIVELDESNNFLSDDFRVDGLPLPDLDAFTAEISQPALLPSNTFEFFGRYRNLGPGYIRGSEFNLTFYLSPDPALGSSDYLLGTTNAEDLSSGYVEFAFEQFTLPPASDVFWQGTGTYYVGFVLDEQNNVQELQEDNNAVATSVFVSLDPAAELIAVSTELSASQLEVGEDFEVTVSYENVSNVAVEGADYEVAFYISRNDSVSAADRLLATVPGVDLLSGVHQQTVQLTLPDEFDSYWSGEAPYSIIAFVDAQNTILEFNEDDNFASAPFTAQGLLPDLWAHKFISFDDEGTAGETRELIYDYDNLGAASVRGDDYVVNFYLSHDEIIDDQDYLLAQAPGVSLAHDQFVQAGIAVTFPAGDDDFWNGPGTYFVGMYVDFENTIIELFEDNNTTSRDIFITLPDLPDGDFNDDGVWDCDDINQLTSAVASGSADLSYDLNGDDAISAADVDFWLAEAGVMNPAVTGGSPFLLGDANLDGIVDGVDFIVWNENKFTLNTNWCDGNFNADNVVDGLDFVVWNENKFSSSMSRPAPDREKAQFQPKPQLANEIGVEPSRQTVVSSTMSTSYQYRELADASRTPSRQPNVSNVRWLRGAAEENEGEMDDLKSMGARQAE